MCKWYKEGRCHKGNACRFSHSINDPRHNNRMAKLPCKYMASGYCIRGEKCTFSHGDDALALRGQMPHAQKKALQAKQVEEGLGEEQKLRGKQEQLELQAQQALYAQLLVQQQAQLEQQQAQQQSEQEQQQAAALQMQLEA